MSEIKLDILENKKLNKRERNKKNIIETIDIIKNFKKEFEEENLRIKTFIKNTKLPKSSKIPKEVLFSNEKFKNIISSLNKSIGKLNKVNGEKKKIQKKINSDNTGLRMPYKLKDEAYPFILEYLPKEFHTENFVKNHYISRILTSKAIHQYIIKNNLKHPMGERKVKGQMVPAELKKYYIPDETLTKFLSLPSGTISRFKMSKYFRNIYIEQPKLEKVKKSKDSKKEEPKKEELKKEEPKKEEVKKEEPKEEKKKSKKEDSKEEKIKKKSKVKKEEE